MKKESIKEAFERVKQDMIYLRDELFLLKKEINELKKTLNSTSTFRQIISTHPENSTHNSTIPQEIEGLKPSNLNSSIGNEGVSTDRQTDRQTDIFHQNPNNQSIETNIKEATDILDSLDKIKKEIRLKFKRLTPQEMIVFSTIYQLEEQNPDLVTYKYISSLLKLSESSIRDYIQRIINKGIPIKKQRFNNKKIILSISSELKKIASLSTIIKLREL